MEQVFVGGHQRQIEDFCGSGEKVIGGITMGKVYRPYRERHFNRQGQLR